MTLATEDRHTAPAGVGIYPQDPIRFLEDQYFIKKNTPIVLEWWQKEYILKPLFYDVEPDGRWKYDYALLGMPKKNGKSTFAGGIGVFVMYCGEDGGEVIVAANDREQASQIIYTKISRAIDMNPKLKRGVVNLKGGIEIGSSGTTCRSISHMDTTSAGPNPNLTLFDELWGFADRKLYDELTPVPTRFNPLVVIVTYAGHNTEGLLWDLYQDGMAGEDLIQVPAEIGEVYVKRGFNDNRMFFFWSHTNLASWIKPEYLERQSKRMPPNVYQRFHENRWAPLTAGFISGQDILNAIRGDWKMQLAPRPNQRYFIALDLGLRHDRTAMAIVHFNGKDQNVYLDQLRIWEGTPADPVSIMEIERALIQAANKFGKHMAATIVIDPWQMEATIQKLRGFYKVEPFNFNTDMTHLSETLVTLFRNERMVIYKDPILIDELEHVYAKQTNRGWRIDHASGRKNDAVVALGMAVTEAVKVGVAGNPGIYF